MTNSSANSSTGCAELFHMLESNKLSDVEEIKKVFHDHFLSTKDSWLVNGLFDYYLSTDSLRAVEVLAGVREPHDKHLFDKLYDALVSKPINNAQRVRTLTLLGHVARRQPTWLYKLANHTLFKQLLYLLKIEEDIVLLMSALLLLITLLPMLPTALTPHLQEIFDVFSRIASLHYHRFTSISSTNTAAFLTTTTTTTTSSLNFINGSDADQLYLLHLQVGLHHLFYRLYAMYPCNFVCYLKQHFLQREHIPVYKKIISPMLDSVRMHPLLVTMSKESEISSSRWKKMEHHDVVAECGRFSLLQKSNRDDVVALVNTRFTPISDYSCPYTPISTTSEFPMPVVDTTTNSGGLLQNGNQDTFWSPSMIVSANSPPPSSNSLQATQLSHNDSGRSAPSTPGGISINTTTTSGNTNVVSGVGVGGGIVVGRNRTSPPEAAVEATPETTPVKDLRQHASSRQMPVGSTVVRALSGIGNGSGSRPSTPTPLLTSTISSSSNNQQHHYQNQHHQPIHQLTTADGNSILNRKLGKIAAERQSAQQQQLLQLHQQQHVRSAEEEIAAATIIRRPTIINREQNLSNGRANAGDNMTMSSITNQQQQHNVQLEDQEVSDIVSSKRMTSYGCSKDFTGIHPEFTKKVRLKFYCKYPTPPVPSKQARTRAKSCPDLASAVRRGDTIEPASIGAVGNTFRPVKPNSTSTSVTTTRSTEESSTQTYGLLPYECLMLDILDRRTLQQSNEQPQQQQQMHHTNELSRLSPSAMLERYIELCAGGNNTSTGQYQDNRIKSRHQSWPKRATPQQLIQHEDIENGQQEHHNSACGSEEDISRNNHMDRQLQLMQMQLQFERQRREVHAERNRRLLGKLRDSRALEELNSSMTNRLKSAENEIEALKSELTSYKKEARTGEREIVDAVHHWQNKCKEEQQSNASFRDRIEQLEDDLKNERKKVTDHEKQTRAAEATLFEAAHQLKEALRAANHCEELKRILDAVQKRFLLLGEAQARIQEKYGGPVHMARQEAVQLQRSWSEEVSGLRRQLDTQSLHLESVRSRLAEFEHRDARKEIQLIEQQRLLQESKEKHSFELGTVESKYKAQVEINLLLEGRILELYGRLEQLTMTYSCGSNNSGQLLLLATSASPKERSPPLSVSLASSSGGCTTGGDNSLAFIHSATTMNDCCDSAGEISNLQAILEPVSSNNNYDNTCPSTSGNNTVFANNTTKVTAASSSNKRPQ